MSCLCTFYSRGHIDKNQANFQWYPRYLHIFVEKWMHGMSLQGDTERCEKKVFSSTYFFSAASKCFKVLNYAQYPLESTYLQNPHYLIQHFLTASKYWLCCCYQTSTAFVRFYGKWNISISWKNQLSWLKNNSAWKI